MIAQYIRNVLVAIDQLFNALAGGDEDETISSRMGKRVNTCGLCKFMCYLLDKIDERHCHKSIEKDEGKNEVF